MNDHSSHDTPGCTDSGHPITEGWSEATQLVQGGVQRSGFDETCEALYMTSGYVYSSAEEAEAAFKTDGLRFVYSRFRNPTVEMFEKRLCQLEGAEACRATASGMAAVWAALIAQLESGDRVVASRALFGSCTVILNQLLPRFGIETVFVDGADLEQWEAALSKPTKAVFLETPSNPGLELVDLAAVSELAHKTGACVVVDNVFASPLLQKPLELGADVVVYSATKHIDGQGRCLGGAILGSQQFVTDNLTQILRHTGPALSPFNAWLLLKGLETLPLRIERQSASAARIADFLAEEHGVAQTRYPFRADHPQEALARRQMRSGGTMVTLEVEGGKERAFRFLNALKLIRISNNLGDSKSLATHPATTTHQRLTPDEQLAQGITPGLIRLSVGLEDAVDLEADLKHGLAA